MNVNEMANGMELRVIEGARSSRTSLLNRLGSQQRVEAELHRLTVKLWAALKGERSDLAMLGTFLVASAIADEGLSVTSLEEPN